MKILVFFCLFVSCFIFVVFLAEGGERNTLRLLLRDKEGGRDGGEGRGRGGGKRFYSDG